MVPVIRALQSSNWARCIVVVTAQHRDLLDQMLTRFGVTVDYDLNLMQPGQSLDQVLARMLPELAEIIQQEEPYAVLAQGDTATVFGAALALQLLDRNLVTAPINMYWDKITVALEQSLKTLEKQH